MAIKYVISYGKKIFWIVAVIALCVGFYNSLAGGQKSVLVNTTRFSVRVADTSEERRLGLSGTQPLKQGEGMLFIFENDDFHGFWMKDMKYSLDIIWINADREVVWIEKNISPLTYPNIFTPEVPARYVLEVFAGESDRAGTKIGTKVSFQLK